MLHRQLTHPRFSPRLDVPAALVLLFGLASLLVLAWSIPLHQRVAQPDRALALIVSRTLDLERAVERVAGWERALFEAVFGAQSGLDEAMRWYAELAGGSDDPAVELHLAILEAEAGRLERLRPRVIRWAARDEPYPLYHRLIEAAYLTDRLAPAEMAHWQSRLAEALPMGWFSDRLASQLAQHAGDGALLAAIRQDEAQRQQELLGRGRGFLAIEIVVAGTGLAVLLYVIVWRGRRREEWQVGHAPIPPPWTGRAGALVLLRGGAAGVLVLTAVLFLGPEGLIPPVLMLPLINAPLLWLAYHGLLLPNGLGFRQGAGLGVLPDAWKIVLRVVPVLATAGLAADWLLALLADEMGLSLHWTEWFDPVLVWGGGSAVGLALVEYLIFAPVFEEIVFRGILFGTLRRRVPFLVAALASAALFALAHGYGPLGFVTVSASGVIWAWSYERTRSLIPGMLAHGLNNALVCTAMLLMLR